MDFETRTQARKSVRRRWALWAAAALIAGLVASACGGDGASPAGRSLEDAELRIADTIQMASSRDVIGVADATDDGERTLVWVFPRPEVRSGCAQLWLLELDGSASLVAEDVPVSRPLLTQAVFSPDGDKIAYAAAVDCAQSPAATEATLVVVGVDGGGRHEIATGITSLRVWTPDDRLFFDRESMGSSLWQVGADGADEEQRFVGRVISVSPDGAYFVTLKEAEGTDGDPPPGALLPGLEFHGLEGGRLLEGTGVSLEGEGGGGWSPDGHRYIYVALTAEGLEGPRVLNLETGETELLASLDDLLGSGQSIPSAVIWSPDGSRLLLQAAPDTAGTGAPLLAAKAVAGKLTELTDGGVTFSDAQWTAHGQLLLYTDHQSVWAAVMRIGEGEDEAKSMVKELQKAFEEPIDLTVEAPSGG